MGTKNNPSAFDCYDAAGPDEPMFILLARDPLAPILVDLWATLRETQGCADHPGRSHTDKAREAHQCAESMRIYRDSLIPTESRK